MSRLSTLFVIILSFCLFSFSSAISTVPALNDVNVLQYALTLENLEYAYYSQGLQFSAQAFANAGYPSYVYTYLQTFQAQELLHVNLINSTLNAINPAYGLPACQYNFTAAMASPTAFLNTAAILESTGVQAYGGGLNGITNGQLAIVAASIATIEARHSAFLNEVTGLNPYPTAFDPTQAPTAIVQLVMPYIVSCPYNVTAVLPGVRPYGVTLGNVSTGAIGSVYTQAQIANDIATLNLALNIEHMEVAFWTYVNNTMNATAFANAGYNATIYNLVITVGIHEMQHAAVLTSAIQARGGVPNPSCNYTFPNITTPQSVILQGLLFETLGTGAYDGAANALTDTALLTVAASIATVEARHAAFLNFTLGGAPYYTNPDTTYTPLQDVQQVNATRFIVSCPAGVNFNVLPVPAPAAFSSTGSSAYTGTSSSPTSVSSTSSFSTSSYSSTSSSSSSSSSYNYTGLTSTGNGAMNSYSVSMMLLSIISIIASVALLL